MSNSFKIVMGLMFVSVVASCGNRNEEVVYADPAPAPMAVPAEPTYSKY